MTPEGGRYLGRGYKKPVSTFVFGLGEGSRVELVASSHTERVNRFVSLVSDGVGSLTDLLQDPLLLVNVSLVRLLLRGLRQYVVQVDHLTLTFCLAVTMSGTGSVNSIPSSSVGLLQVDTPENIFN